MVIPCPWYKVTNWSTEDFFYHNLKIKWENRQNYTFRLCNKKLGVSAYKYYGSAPNVHPIVCITVNTALSQK